MIFEGAPQLFLKEYLLNKKIAQKIILEFWVLEVVLLFGISTKGEDAGIYVIGFMLLFAMLISTFLPSILVSIVTLMYLSRRLKITADGPELTVERGPVKQIVMHLSEIKKIESEYKDGSQSIVLTFERDNKVGTILFNPPAVGDENCFNVLIKFFRELGVEVLQSSEIRKPKLKKFNPETLLLAAILDIIFAGIIMYYLNK